MRPTPSPADGGLERRVMSALKASESRGDPPLLRAVELGRLAAREGLSLPSPEIAGVLVSNLCFDNNAAPMWALLKRTMDSGLVAPLHILALLTAWVAPCWREQPEAFRFYLELMNQYSLSLSKIKANRDRITKYIDNALQLRQIYGLDEVNFGHAVVLFAFSLIARLIDCILEDCCLAFLPTEEGSILYANEVPKTVDVIGGSAGKISEHHEQLRLTNLLMVLEVLKKLTDDKKIKVFLRLVHLNMPEKFSGLFKRLQFIETHKLTIKRFLPENGSLDNIIANIRRAVDKEHLRHTMGALGRSGPWSLVLSHVSEASSWIAFDIYMENAIEGMHLHMISAIHILQEMTRALHVINQASWHESFQALWISALHLVQRDRDSIEGPLPHLESRLCMLLVMVPLCISSLLQEEGESGFEGSSRRLGLISSLQSLGQFSCLLVPPLSLINECSTAAMKAAICVQNGKVESGNIGIQNDAPHGAVGNMLHLIIEACIARKMIDTSAYFWPGVVSLVTSKEPISLRESPWSTFMQGAQLSSSLVNALMTTPASSVADVEKIYHIALNGSEEDKSAAAKILCGASFFRGWNIQEHIVLYMVKLLSPHSDSLVHESTSHYVGHLSMLNSVLLAISSNDGIHVLSLYGLVPEIAAVLMPLCEAFGSLQPPANQTSATTDEPSVYSVFSCAFLCLLRLWKFYKPPREQYFGGSRMELSLDYLLLMRNTGMDVMNLHFTNGTVDTVDPEGKFQPVYMDSFPKLKAWLFQNRACMDFALSALSKDTSVYQLANKILYMICLKMNKGGSLSDGNLASSSGGSANLSSRSASGGTFERPAVPPWEFLEAVPFVLEAVLTACAHGRLSSHDLTIGLRDLMDFFPASLAVIVSYFLAEITRGIWKPVPMNGTDWPNPGSTLHAIESDVKDILDSAGVHISSCYPRGVPPMLPLPLAALVSLTITFKLERNLSYVHAVVTQALVNCAWESPWPSLMVIGALWAQKVRRWHDYMVQLCLQAPFRERDALVQLIRSCLRAFIGSMDGFSCVTSSRGVSALLGQSIADRVGRRLPVSPGYIYLCLCRTFQDIRFVTEAVFKQVLELTDELINGRPSSGSMHLRSTKKSLSSTAAMVRQVAVVAGSMLCVAFGPGISHLLYKETLPMALLTGQISQRGAPGSVSRVLQGYAMAYMLFFCGIVQWGAGWEMAPIKNLFPSRRGQVLGDHMDFIAAALDGDIQIRCDLATWKAYVSCFVCLLVNFVPLWVTDVKPDTLRKVARGLRSWNQRDLALSLLELGGPATMEIVVESLLS